MDDMDILKVIWVGLFVLFVALEIAAPGFVMLPFALGAAATGIASLFEVPILGQLVVFLVSSVIFFLALRPLGKKLNAAENTAGVGANRLIGERGVVVEPIVGDTGLIRIDREEWRADTTDGTHLGVGAIVKVIEVRGTRVMVMPQTNPTEQGAPT